MKSAYLIPLAAALLAAPAFAQKGSIWRCPGNSYTNDAAEARVKNCKLVEGGNITVVEGTKVSPGSGNGVRLASAPPSGASSGSKVDSAEQKARDSDARAILEAELKKAETRHEQLMKEWNNGEPEKQGIEFRNHERYLERVAELKASISRNEQDIAGIRRELSRVGGTNPAKQ